MRHLFLIVILLVLSEGLRAQMLSGGEDESKLYAQTKQVNQFFRRFNGEEDEKGERYAPTDRQYHNSRVRKKYLAMLFDASNNGISQNLKEQFASDVLDRQDPELLQFHGGDWFAEVHTLFTVSSKEIPVVLFMELENDHLGSKWVIFRAWSSYFEPYFTHDTTLVNPFLHPLSHELDFMDLHKAFEKPDSVVQFTDKQFEPDYLTLFLYEVRKGNFHFKTVTDVKFHFFQIPGWYFELSQFNRDGYNSGWLISNLVKLSSDADKNAMSNYLFYGKQ